MNIETERLILRDFVADDWQRISEYQSNPLSFRYYHWSERTAQDVQGFIGRMLNFQTQQPRIKYQMAVILKAENVLIGHCGVRMDTAGAVEADLGYDMEPKYWDHGYATEAARTMLDFGFDRLKVHRIWAACVPENIGSIHVLEKLGMQLEGRFREDRYFKDRWWDSLHYAILEKEWQLYKQDHPVQWKELEG